MNEKFQSAVRRGDLALVRVLLLDEPDLVFDRAEFDFLALHQAVDNDDLDMVQLLLEEGSNVSGVNGEGVGALHMAHSSGMVHLLSDHGANVNLRSMNGWTPLYSSVCQLDEIEVIQALINRGADPSISDNVGQIPEDAARLRGEPEKIKLLKQARGS